MNFKDAAEYLAMELRKRVDQNPRYSLRMFARTLKLSPGELSEILSRKRELSLKSAHKISQALALSPLDSDRLIRLIYSDPASKVKSHAVANDLFHVIGDWYVLAILSLAETKNFKFDIGHISKRLGISLIESKIALERLESTGLLSRKNGRYELTSDYVISPDEIPNEAVRRCHLQMLEKARDAVENQSVEERELGGLTFAVSPKDLPELKSELKNFLDKWAEKVSKNSKNQPTEVYQLETVLFRLSRQMKEPS